MKTKHTPEHDHLIAGEKERCFCSKTEVAAEQSVQATPINESLQEMADAALSSGMYPPRINAVCDAYAAMLEALKKLIKFEEEYAYKPMMGTGWANAIKEGKAAINLAEKGSE